MKNAQYTDLSNIFADLKPRLLQEIGGSDTTEIAAKSAA
jgi:hypothetical protein